MVSFDEVGVDAPTPTAMANGTATAANDEWEYEYDDNETEDFYFTLDLTAHVPGATRLRELAKNGKPKPQQVVNVHAPSSVQARSGPMRDTNVAPQAAGQMQILDLHSKDPLIRVDDKVFSCYWLTDFGTQVYVSDVGVTDSPLRPGHIVDVVGMSRARLIGKPVTVEKRGDHMTGVTGLTSVEAIELDYDTDPNAEDEVATAVEANQQAGPYYSMPKPSQAIDPSLDNDSTPASETTEKEIAFIDRSALLDSTQEKQASFIERLTAIKSRKGETDRVPVIPIRQYELTDEQKATINRRSNNNNTGALPGIIGKPSVFQKQKRKRKTFAELGKKTMAEMAEEERAEKRRKEQGVVLAYAPSLMPVATAASAQAPRATSSTGGAAAEPEDGRHDDRGPG